jgi:N-acetylglucosamine malate deacetylase 1
VLVIGMIALLLPHQDDEFGAFGVIDRCVEAGLDLQVFYLTDGAANGHSPQVRNAESLNVLGRLGVQRDRVHFLGDELRSPDGHLASNLPEVFGALLNALPARTETIYVPAWEGGHPDHDAAALVAVALGHELRIENAVFQFPLYNAYRCRILPFAVFNPIAEAGPVVRQPISRARLGRYCALLHSYRSQWKTFASLLPFIVHYYATDGAQQCQELVADIVSARPHPGPLLYEKRKWLDWPRFDAAVCQFRAQKTR